MYLIILQQLAVCLAAWGVCVYAWCYHFTNSGVRKVPHRGGHSTSSRHSDSGGDSGSSNLAFDTSNAELTRHQFHVAKMHSPRMPTADVRWYIQMNVCMHDYIEIFSIDDFKKVRS